MRHLKVGVIGLGIGANHIAAFESHPQCSVVAVSDLLESKAHTLKSQYESIRFSTQADELLDDPGIDTISIASYDNYHYDQTIHALKNGKHVFVEKPLCLHDWEAQSIRDFLAKRPDLKLSSNFSLRTCPRFRRLMHANEEGELGQPYYVEGDYFWGRIEKLTHGWRKDMPYYSIIHGAAVHMIDLLIWILGKKPARVTAIGNSISTYESSTKFNDFAIIILQFSDGLIVKITANSGCVHSHFHRVTFFGTRKTFLHESTGAVWVDKHDGGFRQFVVEEPYPAKEKRNQVITSFVDWILRDAQPVVSQEDVFTPMSICLAAEKSMREGTPQSIHYY